MVGGSGDFPICDACFIPFDCHVGGGWAEGGSAQQQQQQEEQEDEEEAGACDTGQGEGRACVTWL